MQTCFIAAETVVHPETREILVEKNFLYDMGTIKAIAIDTGMDTVSGRVIMADTMEKIYEVYDRFSHDFKWD